MATTVNMNQSGWKLTTYFGGKLGRCYSVTIPGKGIKTFTEEEFLAFFESVPDRDLRR